MVEDESNLGFAVFPPLIASNGSKGRNQNGKPSGGDDKQDFPEESEMSKGVAVGNPRNGKWRSLFKPSDKESSGDFYTSKLSYFKPQSGNDKKIIISATNFEEEIKVCENFLVGYFVGGRPSFSAIESAVKKEWNPKGKFQMTIHDGSVFLFEFELEEDRATALEHGSIFISSKNFVIRPWHLFIEESVQEIKKIPIWMNLRKIPIHLWNEKGISMIFSALGTPLLADKHTLARTRMSFARVCVEIEVDFDYPDSIPVSFDGKEFNVLVEYSWKPPRCLSCVTFGHSSSKCTKGPKQLIVDYVPASLSTSVEKGLEPEIVEQIIVNSMPKVSSTTADPSAEMCVNGEKVLEQEKSLGEWVSYKRKKGTAKQKNEKHLETPTSLPVVEVARTSPTDPTIPWVLNPITGFMVLMKKKRKRKRKKKKKRK